MGASKPGSSPSDKVVNWRILSKALPWRQYRRSCINTGINFHGVAGGLSGEWPQNIVPEAIYQNCLGVCVCMCESGRGWVAGVGWEWGRWGQLEFIALSIVYIEWRVWHNRDRSIWTSNLVLFVRVWNIYKAIITAHRFHSTIKWLTHWCLGWTIKHL